MNHLLNKKNIKILSGEGREWSAAAESVAVTFEEWISASDIEREEFLKRVEGDTFRVEFRSDVDSMEIIFFDENGTIGIPFVWDLSSGIKKEYFLVDAGFLILYIASFCRGEAAKKKLNDFVVKYVI